MPAQFISNLSIALLWVFLQDEDQFYFTTFVTGYIVGIGIIYLMHRFFGDRFYLARFFAAIKLVLVYLMELIKGSIQIIIQILGPQKNLTPGIFKFETRLRGDWEVTLLALLLILTPGSVVIETTPEGDGFYVHAIDAQDTLDNLIKSLRKFEDVIMEVTR